MTHYDPYDPYQQEALMQPLHADAPLSPNRPPPTRSGTAVSGPRTHETFYIWPVLLLGFLIVLSVAVVCAGLVLEIFVVNAFHVDGAAIYTAAPLGTTLAIAHISSIVIGLSVAPAVGLGGYWLAGRWVAASHDQGVDRPTPFQLGIMMSTLNGANLVALWKGSNYMVAPGGAPGGKALKRPPMLRYAVLMLLLFLTIAYGVSGTDTWLGASSRPVLYPLSTVTSTPGQPVATFGRRVNQTLCEETKDVLTSKPYQCGLLRGTGGNPQAQSQRILAMNGLSNTNVLALTTDFTAIMVPPSANLSMNLGYTATTFGVKANCTSVTSQCVDPKQSQAQAGLETPCPASVNFNTSTVPDCNPYGEIMFGGPLRANGTVMSCGETTNETTFRYGIKLTSSAYSLNNTQGAFVGDTGFYLHGSAGGYNLLTCAVSSLNVTYTYNNGSFAVVSSAPSDLAQAQRIADGTRAGTAYVPTKVEGAGLFFGSYADAFARQLALVALSTTAYVAEPAAALETRRIQLPIGARLPFAPLFTLFGLAGLHCLLVILATASAVRAIIRSGETPFAYSRLTDPATIVGTAYGPDDAKLKPTESVQELFGHETGGDRLAVAVGDSHRFDGLPVVRKATWSEDKFDSR
ncbi:hypothetical protein B0H15DRAFT_1026161 [Mycena belliarum]|uniref:Uncharacterized protein n=1 Tax=Mycena belliarum TaxID=1033014 RepID=A0AAD6TTD5_9AGAR|nr:hypothetical protein B0H15DRAFT_1026161 [Mycena belliae]